MGSLPTIEELLQRNCEYATNKFKAKPRLLGSLPTGTKWSQTLIIACLDSRCNPYEILGVQPSEALVIRNAGGRFAPAKCDIAGFDCLLDVRQLIVLQHNDCASTFVTKDQVLDDIRAKRPDVSEDQLQEIKKFLAMRVDDENGLVSDLKDIRECTFLRKELANGAAGLYLDVGTGLVKQIDG